MKRFVTHSLPAVLATAGVVGAAHAATLDGQNIPLEGLTLRTTQDSPTAFGDSSGTQDSLGGSELNQLFADVNGGVLSLGITGNLQANFNKMFIFFDAVDGGENVLAGDNVDGGFNEINNLAGLTFTAGATPDHGLRLEIGGGFYGVNAFDLIDNSSFSVNSGGGPGDLPLSNVGSGGVLLGWDNSNALGVTDASAATAATATTGFEFEIDLNTLFGPDLNDNIGVTALITSGDGSFISNQVLPGINSTDNIGGAQGAPTIGVVEIPVPEPASLALVGLGGLAMLGRRRK